MSISLHSTRNTYTQLCFYCSHNFLYFYCNHNFLSTVNQEQKASNDHRLSSVNKAEYARAFRCYRFYSQSPCLLIRGWHSLSSNLSVPFPAYIRADAINCVRKKKSFSRKQGFSNDKSLSTLPSPMHGTSRQLLRILCITGFVQLHCQGEYLPAQTPFSNLASALMVLTVLSSTPEAVASGSQLEI